MDKDFKNFEGCSDIFVTQGARSKFPRTKYFESDQIFDMVGNHFNQHFFAYSVNDVNLLSTNSMTNRLEWRNWSIPALLTFLTKPFLNDFKPLNAIAIIIYTVCGIKICTRNGNHTVCCVVCNSSFKLCFLPIKTNGAWINK